MSLGDVGGRERLAKTKDGVLGGVLARDEHFAAAVVDPLHEGGAILCTSTGSSQLSRHFSSAQSSIMHSA